MTSSPANRKKPATPQPPVVYAGFFPCPVCGYTPREYAHMSDGHVYAAHVYTVVLNGWMRRMQRLCILQ